MVMKEQMQGLGNLDSQAGGQLLTSGLAVTFSSKRRKHKHLHERNLLDGRARGS